jgi:cytoskeletal protein RodZ
MAIDPNNVPEQRTGLRLYVVGSVVVFALVLGYLGWVFFSRWQTNHAFAQKAAEAAAEKRAQDKTTFEGMGGNSFEILAFYASPSAINRGDSVSLCYSVSNAKSVTLEPQTNAVWPSYERCVSVSPTKTTTYTLTATDAAGKTKSAQVIVKVE